MSDLVQRLRQEADDIEMEPTECLWWEAADEIERLRAELFKERTKAALIAIANDKLRAELAKERTKAALIATGNEKLRAELAEKDKRIEELDRECARLMRAMVCEMTATGGCRITIDQIAKAWKMASIWPDAATPEDMKLLLKEVFNIHRCEACGGSGRWRVTSEKCPDCAAWGSHGFVVKP